MMTGIVDFDPEKWSRANAGEVEAGEPAKPAKLAKETPALATLATLAASPPSLPTELRDGLLHLRRMDRPRMAEPKNWPVIVSDCQRLASEGWAQQALALGWEPLQLWGVSPAAGGMVDLEGLGIWLNGRRVLLLDAASCIVESGPGSHSIFNRRSMGGSVLVWEIGRGK